MRAFRAARSDLRHRRRQMFNYPVTAGTILQPPMPHRSLLPMDASGNVPNTEVPGITDVRRTTRPPATTPASRSRIARLHGVYRGPHVAMPVNSLSISSAGTGYATAPTVGFTGGGPGTVPYGDTSGGPSSRSP